MQLAEITPERVEELKAFLAQEPVQNLFALGVLEEHGIGGGARSNTLIHFGLFDGNALQAVAQVGGDGGLVIPCGTPGMAGELGKALGERVNVRGVAGERASVDAFVRALGLKPRVTRLQTLFVASADDLGPFVCPTLRAAEPSELEKVVGLSAAAIKEFQGDDPLARDRDAFVRRVEARVAAGRTLVVADGGVLVGKVDVGVKSRFGAELEGVYALPERRGTGLEAQMLGQLSRALLSTLPRVAVRVDEADPPLAAVCRRAGFSPAKTQRVAIV